ncbi:MAG: Fe-S cluster assembly protein SufD, partial [Rudaea sp.]
DTPGLSVRHDSANRCELIVSTTADGPVHLVYLSVPGEAAGFWTATCSVRVQAGAYLDLVEQHIGEDGADVFGRLNADFALAEHARMHVSCLSDLADNASLLRAVCCNVGQAAFYDTTQAHCGGRLQRIESSIDLVAEQAGLRERGVFALRGRQHVDVHLDVRHEARDTASDVVWRGVADQRARGILHGAIAVAQGADGADAKLQTKNLLLSPHAEIDAQPVLEIYADEVKAAHGATVGQLDERALFYLRSRGIDVKQARAILIDAFCREIYADIADADLRERFASLLSRHLLQATPVAP